MSTEIAAAGLKDSEYKAAAAKQAANTLFRPDNPQENAIATGLRSLFGSGEGFQSINLSEDLYRRLKTQYANLIAVDGNKDSILEEGLKPISSFIGSTLLKLTGLQEDSLGSKFDLPSTLSSMLEKTNPQLHAKFKSTYESFNAQKLSEMPSQMYGNTKQLAENSEEGKKQSNGQGINLPPGLQDTYRGLEDLVGKANDFVTDAVESLQKQLSNVNKIIPQELTQLLGNTDQFTGQIQGLTGQFGNIEQLKGITDKLNVGNLDFNNFLKGNPLDALQSLGGSFGDIGNFDQLTSFLQQNPLQNVLQGGMPSTGGILDKAPNLIQDASGALQTGTGAQPSSTTPTFSLPDPKEALKGFLPSQITDGLSKLGLGDISGFGFTGNIPFGLEKALEAIGGDVLGSILNKFAGQLPFLAGIIGGISTPGETPSSYPNEAGVKPAPDGTVSYTVDRTSGTVIKPTAPKPVYGGTNIPGTTTTRASESGAGRFGSRNTTQGSQGAATQAVAQGVT
jgi:hypothetical protein